MGLFGNKNEKNDENNDKIIQDIIVAKNPNIQKWEYLTVIEQDIGSGEWKISSITGVELKDWKKRGTIFRLNQFGEQGWELVVYEHHAITQNWIRYIFKRPKSV